MDFRPTQEMLDAIEKVKKCREIKNEICPIVMKYKTEILKQMQAKPEEYLKEYSGVPEVILNPEHAWMMEKNDYLSYMSRCTIEKNSHSLNVDKMYAPFW